MSQRQARRSAFTNGEVVFSGNVASKKIDELKDICWALAASEEGTKDALIATIKTRLADPAIQNSLKFSGLYFGRRLTANDENAPPPPPHQSPPTRCLDPPLASMPSSTSAPTSHLPALPPPSFYHSAPMPPLPSISSQSYRPYFPLQPTSHTHSNTYSNIPSTSSSVHPRQLIDKLSTLPPSHFYTQ